MSKKKRKPFRMIDLDEFRCLTIVRLAEEVARLSGEQAERDGKPTEAVINAIMEAEDLAAEVYEADLEGETVRASYGLMLSGGTKRTEVLHAID